jgi:hypothetical protein
MSRNVADVMWKHISQAAGCDLRHGGPGGDTQHQLDEDDGTSVMSPMVQTITRLDRDRGVIAKSPLFFCSDHAVSACSLRRLVSRRRSTKVSRRRSGTLGVSPTSS